MSTNLRWRPIQQSDTLGYDLKRVLGPRLWGHDGSLGGEWIEVTRDLIPFLEGILAGATNDNLRSDTQRLIDLINDHGSIELCISG